MTSEPATYLERLQAWIRNLASPRRLPQSAEVGEPATFWNAKWRKSIADKRLHQFDRVPDPRSAFLHLVEWFDGQPWRRVLVVGGGISTEPAVLEHLGYEVVAIDISEVAISHLRKHPATRDELAAWLRCRRPPGSEESRVLDQADSLALLDEARRDGGSLELVCSAFQAFELDAPVDVVYCPRSWQCLDGGGRRELAQRAFQWIVPGGACRILTQNLRTTDSKELDDAFLHAGFFRRNESAHGYSERRQGGVLFSWDRYNELAEQDDVRAKERLASGEKMFDVYNASG